MNPHQSDDSIWIGAKAVQHLVDNLAEMYPRHPLILNPNAPSEFEDPVDEKRDIGAMILMDTVLDMVVNDLIECKLVYTDHKGIKKHRRIAKPRTTAEEFASYDSVDLLKERATIVATVLTKETLAASLDGRLRRVSKLKTGRK